MTGMDKVRLANTGSEATMHALRIARATPAASCSSSSTASITACTTTCSTTRRPSRRQPWSRKGETRPIPTSRGIPRGIQEYLLTLPYNDIDAVERVFKRRGEQIAAVMVEPVMGNTAGIVPRLEWLQAIRRLCDAYGVVLIFDEVKTGFRLANGGAQEYFGVKADLAAYAKAMGNGYPVAAIAGREAIMAPIDDGDVAHGGTYVGNVPATRGQCHAGDAETEPIIETIFARGKMLMDGIEVLTRHDVPHAVTGIPSMFSLVLGTDEPPYDYHSYDATDHELYEELVGALIERGVMPDDDSRSRGSCAMRTAARTSPRR
ncbi:MAG: aminotransferase class III-fold pyridoxal phosphate-dependent enzyme [Caldilineaceae bacterium]